MSPGRGNRNAATEVPVNIKSSVLLETKHGNKYLVDRRLKRTHLLHPLLHHIIRAAREGFNPDQWLHLPETEKIGIENLGPVPVSTLKYYVRKYRLLEENGYFGGIDLEKRLGARIQADDIKYTLANAARLTFEVTDACNLDCDYCGYGKFYAHYDRRHDSKMNLDAAKKLLHFLLELWNSPLNQSHNKPIHIGFYGGEPLMNFPFIRDMVAYARQLPAQHNQFRFQVTTNALLLEKYMDFLVENDFHLLISLDGSETNNRYRALKNGTSSFRQVVKNIHALREKYPDYFDSGRVIFNAVLHNKNSAQEIYRYIKDTFGKVPRIAELNQTGVKKDLEEDFRQRYRNLTESLGESEDYSLIEKDMLLGLPGVKDVSLFIMRNSEFFFYNYDELIYPPKELKRLPTATCLPFFTRVFMTVNGKLLACERIGQQHSLGTATPHGVEVDYGEIAERYNRWLDKMRRSCNKCYNADDCKQCIFLLDLRPETPVCNGLIDYDGYSRYLSSVLGVLEDKPGAYAKILESGGNE